MWCSALILNDYRISRSIGSCPRLQSGANYGAATSGMKRRRNISSPRRRSLRLTGGRRKLWATASLSWHPGYSRSPPRDIRPKGLDQCGFPAQTLSVSSLKRSLRCPEADIRRPENAPIFPEHIATVHLSRVIHRCDALAKRRQSVADESRRSGETSASERSSASTHVLASRMSKDSRTARSAASRNMTMCPPPFRQAWADEIRGAAQSRRVPSNGEPSRLGPRDF